ncbi:hypothetical protein B382_14478 [Stutzerimonas stutzeri B1SMN1]|nr:hypothetical protein B382_14478 [Stutzerimonas stutzeri B1SMN1]
MCNDIDPFRSFYRLKRPCANCPFRKTGGIDLRGGRLDAIIAGLVKDDSQSFLCHKTLNTEAKEADEELVEDDESQVDKRRIYEAEKMCAGAAAYLLKAGRPTIGMRYAMITGSVSPDHWSEAESLVIDPAGWWRLSLRG